MHKNLLTTVSSLYSVDKGSKSDTVGPPQTKLRQLNPQTYGLVFTTDIGDNNPLRPSSLVLCPEMCGLVSMT